MSSDASQRLWLDCFDGGADRICPRALRQREVRIVLEAPYGRPQALVQEFFEIGPMDDYAELL